MPIASGTCKRAIGIADRHAGLCNGMTASKKNANPERGAIDSRRITWKAAVGLAGLVGFVAPPGPRNKMGTSRRRAGGQTIGKGRQWLGGRGEKAMERASEPGEQGETRAGRWQIKMKLSRCQKRWACGTFRSPGCENAMFPQSSEGTRCRSSSGRNTPRVAPLADGCGRYMRWQQLFRFLSLLPFLLPRSVLLVHVALRRCGVAALRHCGVAALIWFFWSHLPWSSQLM
jgi:hypothetical protein